MALTHSHGIVHIFLLTCTLLLEVAACTRVRYYESGDQESRNLSGPSAERAENTTPYRRHDTERGIASFMADETHGRRTANGEMYDMRQMVAAHLTLPFNSMVRVRNLKNGLEVEVRINDRGPYVRGRIIDLSLEAAKRLGLVEHGSGEVEIEVLELP